MGSQQAAQDALFKLKQSRDSFIFSLGAYALLTKEPAASLISEYSISATNIDLSVNAAHEDFKPAQGVSYRFEFGRSIPQSAAMAVVQNSFYSMLSDSFEACKAASPEKIKDEEWYSLARHLRNAISHNGRWHFLSPNGFPVGWRSLKVDYAMQGKSIDGFVGWYDGLQLNAVMYMSMQDIANAP